MYVRHLVVSDFRSWARAELRLQPGPNLIVGANGQGKTNLVEAIGYLATLGSHRVATDAPLIRFGTTSAVVQAAVATADREIRVEVQLNAAAANRARLNGAPVRRPREVLGIVRVVLFAPEDLAVVRGDPSERRRFLDELVVARSPRLAAVRADYERVLKQRTALLKSAAAARRGGDLGTLDVWDAHLVSHGAVLLHARLQLVRALAPHAARAYAEVAPSSVQLHLRYSSALRDQLPELDGAETLPAEDELADALRAALAAVRPAELERGVTLVGPHRDDLDLTLGALPVRGYASHGEGWSAALALRLGSFELLRSDGLPGGDPVLILDDVFAELDAGRRVQLANAATRAEQAIVTAAVGADVPAELAGVTVEVVDGQVRDGS